jgi:hypothetical protein
MRVRTSFAHAALQYLATTHGVEVLHIKGVAISRSLTTEARAGTDADVLVRPSHVPTLLAALRTNGWTVHTTFATGSPFEHATTLVHEAWGFADIHRLFPGITAPPEVAFDRLWHDRSTTAIAGVDCPVPSIPAQAMILVLNAARSGLHGQSDLETAWSSAPADRQVEVRRLVEDLGAQVAFAAGTGDLDRFRDDRNYDLWRVTSEGGTRFEEWRARIKAAPSWTAAVRLVVRAPMVNRDHLAAMLGRPPTRGDMIREFFARPVRGLTEQWLKLRARVKDRSAR